MEQNQIEISRLVDADNASMMAMTTSIVAAFVGNNHMQVDQIPNVISTTFRALKNINEIPAPAAEAAATPEPILVPPVEIGKSVTPDFLISLEDGKPYKSLKRHLATRGMTPSQYREKWNLARDYPMVAPNYAARRSELAKASGLGRPLVAQAEELAAVEPLTDVKPKRSKARGASAEPGPTSVEPLASKPVPARARRTSAAAPPVAAAPIQAAEVRRATRSKRAQAAA